MQETRVFRCVSCGGVNRVVPARLTAGPKCGRCATALPIDGEPVVLSDDELDRLVQTSPVPVLVDFYADWCQPCRSLAPLLAQLGKNHAGKLIVAKVDTERNPRNAGQLGVEGIPAVYLFRGGKPVDQRVGLHPFPEWERFVAPHLG